MGRHWVHFPSNDATPDGRKIMKIVKKKKKKKKKDFSDFISKRVCCQSISETLNESRKRTRTFSGLFVRISTLTYCIPYILHVHDSIWVCFSNISAYFARNADSLITQGSSRKSCSLAGGFVPTRSHRGGEWAVGIWCYFERRNEKHQFHRCAYRP